MATIYVCTHHRFGVNASCGVAGSPALVEALRAEIALRRLDWVVATNTCMGHCTIGPNLKAVPGGPMLHHCTTDKASALLDQLMRDWHPDAPKSAAQPASSSD